MNVRKTWLILAAVLLTAVFAVAQSASTTAQSDKAAASQSSPTASKAADHRDHGKIDINSASKEELIKLPGIGPVTAQKIIDGRPYRAKSDLLNRNIVSESEYGNISSQIVAHKVTSAKQ